MPNLWEKSTTDAATATTAPDDWVMRFTVGDDYLWDRVLLPYDVTATRGHIWGLKKIGVLSEKEYADVEDALDDVMAAFESGTITVTPSDEDSHTVIENELTERLGSVGEKIHAGRSRNDQVLAALRLYLQDAIQHIGRQVGGLVDALCGLAERHPDTLMPGYTHLQRAMPSTVALWALGYAETLVSDLDGLRHVREQVNVSPLGSAAGYGVPHLDLPREEVAERLGFRAVQTHVTSVQLSRGKHEMAVVHALVQMIGTVNRLASDLILYATSEFGFVDLPDAHCTGSSIMPQKKNPDVLELSRGAYAGLVGELQSLAVQPANLPGGYHRDLQRTKGALMRSLQQSRDVLDAVTAVVEGVTFQRERTEAACTPDLMATHRALEQVAEGVSFRTAYREAAVDLNGAASLDPADVLATYATPGSLGRERPQVVRVMLDQQEWLERVESGKG
ncbi:argininosuccinate lyase [Longibacter salinarum]|uniref:Argininosuccinate lyase n=1 Tax=Longibacter salinarum TaxID=1850348 RepID=A0A2A8D0L6_9BACT|nr:argininosuccinate lyase [Longibacter salinarum]PEN14421.1 argininosuccinate lyase [Longibacter salinarum]